MIPNIPDNIFKILFAIGLFLIGYSYLRIEKVSQQKIEANRLYDQITDSVNSKSTNVNNELKNIKAIADDLSKKYKITNPVTQKKDTYVFREIITGGSKNQRLVNDRIAKLWDKHAKNKAIYNTESEKLQRRLDVIKEDIQNYTEEKEFWNNAPVIGFMLSFLGFIGLMHFQSLQNKLLLNQISEKSFFQDCQSCGKRFNATVRRAKFSDGTINTHYCHECFENDVFTNPDLNVNQVLNNYISALNKPDYLDKVIARNKIATLRRWKVGKY